MPGGGGHGGAGSRATSTSGQPYGDGSISHLLGGSGGGGYTVDSGGAGGEVPSAWCLPVILNLSLQSTIGEAAVQADQQVELEVPFLKGKHLGTWCKFAH